MRMLLKYTTLVAHKNSLNILLVTNLVQPLLSTFHHHQILIDVLFRQIFKDIFVDVPNLISPGGDQ